MLENVPLVGSVTTGFGDKSIEALAPSARTPNLVEASQDFVGMLYGYVFSQMRESASNEEEGLFSGPHVNMLMGFLDQEIGKQLAATQGQSLAQELLNQLTGGKPVEQVAQNTATVLGKLDTRSIGQTENPALNTPRILGKLDTRQYGVVSQTDESPNPAEIDNANQILEALYELNQRK